MVATKRHPGLGSLRPEKPPRRRIDATRRDALLGKLQELLLSEGFSHLTVDDFAARLQCSKTTLYAISSSKEHLVTTVIKHFFRDATAHIEDRVRDVSDPPDRIAIYLAGVGSAMRAMSPSCYADMVTHDATRDIYALNSRAAAERVRTYIDEGVRSGAFRAVNARFIGEAVSLLIDGIQHGELLDRTGLESGDAFTQLSDLVVAALTNNTDTIRRRSAQTAAARTAPARMRRTTTPA